jgi:hypothetical protein
MFGDKLGYFNTNLNNPVRGTTQRKGLKQIEQPGAARVVRPSKPADGVTKCPNSEISPSGT